MVENDKWGKFRDMKDDKKTWYRALGYTGFKVSTQRSAVRNGLHHKILAHWRRQNFYVTLARKTGLFILLYKNYLSSSRGQRLLFQDISDWTRVQTGEMRLEPEPFDYNLWMARQLCHEGTGPRRNQFQRVRAIFQSELTETVASWPIYTLELTTLSFCGLAHLYNSTIEHTLWELKKKNISYCCPFLALQFNRLVHNSYCHFFLRENEI